MTAARIMVVEDERITAEDLRDILADLGYEVTAVVASGAEALEQAGRTSPDLVLMDIRIKGDLDGIETALKLREQFGIPVIYLTAHADQDTLERAREAEPLGYIVKPFQELELEASIEMALHNARADRQARQREQALSSAVEAIGEGVISSGRDGVIAFLNPAAEAWTGWSRQEAVGVAVDQVFRLRDAGGGASHPLLAALESGALSEMAAGSVLVSHDGSEKPVGGSAAPLRDPDGAVSGAVLVFGGIRQESAAEPVSDTAASPAGVAGGFDLVVHSTAMRRVMNFAQRVAASEVSTILLLGESGTGKDVLAKFMHYHSSRRDGPFIAINCAAIPDTLLESELFGYEKGAFTDARSQKRGILELASGGTALLDEVAELPLVLQAKLLRVLEDQNFRRLGGTRDIGVDVRVIAATNRDLREAVRTGEFRLDLYYRLNVVQVEVPALREHKDDILPMANHFLRMYNRKFKRDVQGVSPAAAEALLAHDWPGNVRELRNTIERAMVLEDTAWVQPSSLGFHGVATLEMDLPAARAEAAAVARPLEDLPLEEAERAMVVRALEKAGWNQTHAARLLGVTRDTIRYKIKKFDLKPAAK